MLKLTHLTKKFGGLMAVDDLSLEVGAGEIFACIGPNGSGKTTTVKMLAGLYIPTSGAVEIGGIDIRKEPERAKALIGYVPDEPYVYEKMSGREFLGFVGALYGMKREDAQRDIAEWASRFPGLAEVLDGLTESYSRGNKQKLAFAAAFLHRPKLLLIDEPMVGLDPQSALAVKGLLKHFAQQGGAVFLCTHTLPVAEELATRIGVLEKGRMIAVGTLTGLRQEFGAPKASLEDVYMVIANKNPNDKIPMSNQ